MKNQASNSDGLTSAQVRAIEALLTLPSITAAAKTVGVTDRTLRRWLAEDGPFKGAVRQARADMLTHASARLAAACSAAADTLVELLDSEVRDEVRVAAARSILASAAKAEEVDNLAARLEELEKRAADADARTTGNVRKFPQAGGQR
jgi:hypothetical protein